MATWQIPKEDYSDRVGVNPGVTETDLNRIESNIEVLLPMVN